MLELTDFSAKTSAFLFKGLVPERILQRKNARTSCISYDEQFSVQKKVQGGVVWPHYSRLCTMPSCESSM